MSALRIYWPAELSLCSPDDAEVATGDGHEPVILSFPTRPRAAAAYPLSGMSGSVFAQTPVDRARLLHQNRCCPGCGRGSVVPNEHLALAGTGDRMPVPGAGTIVGFQCTRCRHHWDV